MRLLKSLGRENPDIIQIILCQYRLSEGLNCCTLGYSVVCEDEKAMPMLCKVIIVHPSPTEK